MAWSSGGPTDKRGALVTSNAKGRRALEAAAPVHDGVVRRQFLDVVSDRELAAIRRADEWRLTYWVVEPRTNSASGLRPR